MTENQTLSSLLTQDIKQFVRTSEDNIKESIDHPERIKEIEKNEKNSFGNAVALAGELASVVITRINNKWISEQMQSYLYNQHINDIKNPPTALLGKYKYRQADGSFNSFIYPDAGKSETPYSICTQSRYVPTKVPNASEVIKELFSRKPDTFKPSTINLNANFTYFITLLIHDFYYSDPKNPEINKTTSYLDLSPLYGYNAQRQHAVRSHINGKLKTKNNMPLTLADASSDPEMGSNFMQNPYSMDATKIFCFGDERVSTIPPLAIMLTIFMREHNRICDELLKHYPEKEYSDEDLFQQSRLIVTAIYKNIVFKEYVLGAVSESFYQVVPDVNTLRYQQSNLHYGNSITFEFLCAYRFHGLIPNYPEGLIEGVKKYNLADYSIEDLITKFKSTDAGDLSPCNIPAELAGGETAFLEKTRKFGMCTINEFRQHFELPPFAKFEELNSDPKIVEILKKHYDSIDNVDLYVGLMVESKPDFMLVGTSLGQGLITDYINLMLNDRFFTLNYDNRTYTPYGFHLAENTTIKDLIHRNTKLTIYDNIPFFKTK
jgi:hypothetical protein